MKKTSVRSLVISGTASFFLTACQDNGISFIPTHHEAFLASDIKTCINSLNTIEFGQNLNSGIIMRANKAGTADCRQEFHVDRYTLGTRCIAYPRGEAVYPFTIAVEKFNGFSIDSGVLVRGKTILNREVLLVDNFYQDGSEFVNLMTSTTNLGDGANAKANFKETQYLELAQSPDLHCPQLSEADKRQILMLAQTVPARFTPHWTVRATAASFTPN